MMTSLPLWGTQMLMDKTGTCSRYENSRPKSNIPFYVSEVLRHWDTETDWDTDCDTETDTHSLFLIQSWMKYCIGKEAAFSTLFSVSRLFPTTSGASPCPASVLTNLTGHWPSLSSGKKSPLCWAASSQRWCEESGKEAVSPERDRFHCFLLSRLNHYFGGGGQQTWPFHGTNLILHGCATFLLRCICKRTLQLSNFTTWTATSLFALHPIHTEAVRYILQCYIPQYS